MNRIISWVFIVLLTGCTASTSTLPPAESISQSLSLDSKDSRYEDLTPGAQVVLNDPAFFGEIKVIVGQKYQSALGLNCYQVKVDDTALAFESVAICQKRTGTWFVAPRIWARSTAGNR